MRAELEALWEDPSEDLGVVTIAYEERLSGLVL